MGANRGQRFTDDANQLSLGMRHAFLPCGIPPKYLNAMQPTRSAVGEGADCRVRPIPGPWFRFPSKANQTFHPSGSGELLREGCLLFFIAFRRFSISLLKWHFRSGPDTVESCTRLCLLREACCGCETESLKLSNVQRRSTAKK